MPSAWATTGLRFLFGERAYDRIGTSIGDPAPYQLDRALGQKHIETIEKTFANWNGKADGRIRIAISAWAPDMCSPELLEDLSALQKKLGTWMTIHLNQIWGEVAAVQAHRNRLPTEYLADLGFLNEKVICAHCRCMDPREEKLLGEAKVIVAFNAAIAARRGLSPRIEIARVAGLHHHHGLRQHGRGHGRGDAHRHVHGAHPPRGRTAADARAGAALGEAQRLQGVRHARRRLAGAPATRPTSS